MPSSSSARSRDCLAAERQAPESYESLRGNLGLHGRSARDFPDTLVALGFLACNGDVYAITMEAGRFD